MKAKILFVDDEEHILHGYKLALRKQFMVYTALGGEEALKALKEHGPFSVIVSDMKMPGMDGIEVLRRVRELSPDTVRVMLTGYAELQTTVKAVNSGHIFRFLTKPCPAEDIAVTLEDCLEQYRLVTAEKILLERTLNGSITMLTDVLGMVNPSTFGRAQRIRDIVEHMIAKLGIGNIWEFKIAAMLSQIGCITMSQESLEKIYAGRALDEDEQRMLEAHPSTGGQLLGNIPRLETVAKMVELQMTPFREFEAKGEPQELPRDVLGAQLLRVAVDFDRLIIGGKTQAQAAQAMRNLENEHNPALIASLKDLDDQVSNMVIKQVLVQDLKLDMIVNEDVLATNGLLLVTKGQRVSLPVLQRLKQYSEGSVGIVEPICVMVQQLVSDEPALVS